MKRALALAFLVAAASGCVRVKPYQREYLSLRPMRPTAESGEDRFRAHYQGAREGSIGGGCGCN